MFASYNNSSSSDSKNSAFSHLPVLRYLPILLLALISACAAPRPVGVPPGGPLDYSSRFYIAGGAGSSWLEPLVEGADDVVLEENRGVVGNIAIGLDTSQRTSLELQLADLGEAELNTGARIGYQTGSVAFSGRLLRARSGINLYAKLGVGTLLGEDSDLPGVNVVTNNNFNLLTGVGIEFLSRQGLGLRLEYVGYDTDAQFAGVNLVYHFGGRSRSNRPANSVVANPSVEQETVTVVDRVDVPVEPPPVPTVEPTLEPTPRPQVVERPRIDPIPVETQPLPRLPAPLPTASQPVASTGPTAPLIVQSEPRPTLPEPVEASPPTGSSDFEFEVTVAGDSNEFLEVEDRQAPAAINEPPALVPVPTQVLVDSDADGVIDDFDTCDASPAGLPVNDDGCERYNGVINGIGFDAGAVSIAQTSLALLNQVATDMVEYPDLKLEMLVQSAADSREERLLARRRTLEVFRYLRAQGVNANRLRALPPVVANGSSNPAVILRSQPNR